MTGRLAQRAAVVLAGLLPLGVGCGTHKLAKPMCTSDPECGPVGACMAGICLPRGSERTVAVEIVPRADSMSARTDHAVVSLAWDARLVADDRVTLAGSVMDAPDAHVVLLSGSPIPGQPDIQFETDLIAGGQPNLKTFQLDIGSGFLSRPAVVWLQPSAQPGPAQPPTPFTTTLDQGLNLTFPAASQIIVVRGALHDSLDMPPAAPFVAKAYAGTTVVSNMVTTDAAGVFQLLISPGAIPDSAQNTISVDLTAMGDPNTGIRFRTLPFTVDRPGSNVPGATSPRVFRLPAYVTPAPLRFTVLARDPVAGAALPDVTVRFRSEPINSPDGAAVHEREYRTNGEGQVEAALIGGTATEPRNYQITILPPPDSGYAGRCVPQHQVTGVGNGGPTPYSTAFSLDPKVSLVGTVLANDGSPAATVSVTATPAVASIASPCSSPTSNTAVSATTDRNGAYVMLLDPGSYKIDIEPPMGAPLPRLTEEGDQALWVDADSSTSTHDVMLPAGEAVDAVVAAANGTPLVAAGVRIFEVLCSGGNCLQPALRAQARSDNYGKFRVVLPVR